MPILPPRGVLSHSTRILHRTGIDLEALAQFVELDRVGEEFAVVVDDIVGEDGLPSVRSGDIGARRPVPCFGLLFWREMPGDKKFCGVWMRRGFENRRRVRPDRQRIVLRKSDGLHQSQILLVHADAGDGIERNEAFP